MITNILLIAVIITNILTVISVITDCIIYTKYGRPINIIVQNHTNQEDQQ